MNPDAGLWFTEPVGVVRLELRLANQAEWVKIFDPRDWTVFVPTAEQLATDTPVCVDLDVGGWMVVLRGAVIDHRAAPAGVVVALGRAERDKINYLNGYVRGGLINHREKRRLPLKLPVTYGAVEGPATTTTKDFNEEGLFLFTDRPLPETSQVHMLVTVPNRAQPLSLMGKVSHTITTDDEEAPGMGIVFECDERQREQLVAIVKDLEDQLHAGELPAAITE